MSNSQHPSQKQPREEGNRIVAKMIHSKFPGRFAEVVQLLLNWNSTKEASRARVRPHVLYVTNDLYGSKIPLPISLGKMVPITFVYLHGDYSRGDRVMSKVASLELEMKTNFSGEMVRIPGRRLPRMGGEITSPLFFFKLASRIASANCVVFDDGEGANQIIVLMV